MVVVYNGIFLSHAFTESWEEQVVYDSSGVNVLGNKITMSFQGNVYPAAVSYAQSDSMYPNVMTMIDDRLVDIVSADADDSGDDDDGDADEGDGLDGTEVVREKTSQRNSFAKRLKVILRRLSMPRHDLFVYGDDGESDNPTILFEAYSYYRVNGDKLTSESQKRSIDVNNGPKPISVRIVQKTEIYALISFTIEVTKIRCLGGETGDVESDGYKKDPNNALIVAHRCWTEETIDNHFYTTRTTSGKIQLSNGQVGAHWARSVWRPPLEMGFRRESIRFSESEDGLSLSYVVTDKQVQNAAPYPATSFSGNVSYSVVNAAEMSLQMTISLVGRPDFPRYPLLVRGMQAVTSKLRSFADVAKGIIEKLTVSENIDDPPTVTVSMTARLFAGTVGKPEANGNEVGQVDIYLPLIEKIGEGVVFSGYNGSGGAYQETRYNRLLSSIPNQSGYNPYIVVDASEVKKSDEKDALKNTLFTWGQIKRSETAGFIHSLVAGECNLREGISYGTDYIGGTIGESYGYTYLEPTGPKDAIVTKPTIPGGSGNGSSGVGPNSSGSETSPIYLDMSTSRSTISEQYTGGVHSQEQDSENTTFSQALVVIERDDSLKIVFNKTQSALPVESIVFPYTVYKSDISYSTDYNRVPLPQKNQYKSPATIRQKIEELQAQTPTLYRDAQIKALKKQLHNTRTIELSRPIPTARVIIEAERTGLMPELPDPDKTVTYEARDSLDDETAITFTPIGVKITQCEPTLTPLEDNIIYKVIAIYDYVMSRTIAAGDKILLLSNQRYESAAYPNDNEAAITFRQLAITKMANNTKKVAQGKPLMSQVVAFSGGQLSHSGLSEELKEQIATNVSSSNGNWIV